MGLYLYASGAQRQVLSVLSTVGFCSSYTSLAGSGDTHNRVGEELPQTAPDKPPSNDAGEASVLPSGDEDDDPDWLPDLMDEEESTGNEHRSDEEERADKEDSSQDEAGEADANAGQGQGRDRDAIESAEAKSQDQAPVGGVSGLLYRGAGLLRRISVACRTSSRQCAQTSLCGHVYDNINMMFKIAEQILGRKDSQENGTCATIFPLYDARPEDMQTSDLLNSFDAAPPLSLDDILHTPAEAKLFHESLTHAALRDLVSSSDLFTRFRSEVDKCLPATDDQIPLHRTEVYPLPAMNIDESSITGNAEVVDTMFKELGFDIGTTKFCGIVRPMFGDQLSIARLRSLITNRAGHDMVARSYAHLVFGPGFFHHQLAITHGILQAHWGDPHAGTSNPASLSFFNTVLDRKPIVLTSLPPYRACRDLIHQQYVTYLEAYFGPSRPSWLKYGYFGASAAT